MTGVEFGFFVLLLLVLAALAISILAWMETKTDGAPGPRGYAGAMVLQVRQEAAEVVVPQIFRPFMDLATR
jgi:hypothetical protein